MQRLLTLTVLEQAALSSHEKRRRGERDRVRSAVSTEEEKSKEGAEERKEKGLFRPLSGRFVTRIDVRASIRRSVELSRHQPAVWAEPWGNETVMELLRHSIKCTVMLALTSSLDVSFLLEVLGTFSLSLSLSFIRTIRCVSRLYEISTMERKIRFEYGVFLWSYVAFSFFLFFSLW